MYWYVYLVKEIRNITDIVSNQNACVRDPQKVRNICGFLYRHEITHF